MTPTPTGSSSPASPASRASRSAPRPPAPGQPSAPLTDANGHYLLEVPAGSYNVAPTNPPGGLHADDSARAAAGDGGRGRAVSERRLRLRLAGLGHHRQPGVPRRQQGRRLQQRRHAAGRRQRGSDPRHHRQPDVGCRRADHRHGDHGECAGRQQRQLPVHRRAGRQLPGARERHQRRADRLHQVAAWRRRRGQQQPGRSVPGQHRCRRQQPHRGLRLLAHEPARASA